MFRVRKRVMMIVVTATIVSTIVLVDNCYCYDLYSCISIVFHEWRTIISLGRLGFHGSHTSASSEISWIIRGGFIWLLNLSTAQNSGQIKYDSELNRKAAGHLAIRRNPHHSGRKRLCLGICPGTPPLNHQCDKITIQSPEIIKSPLNHHQITSTSPWKQCVHGGSPRQLLQAGHLLVSTRARDRKLLQIEMMNIWGILVFYGIY